MPTVIPAHRPTLGFVLTALGLLLLALYSVTVALAVARGRKAVEGNVRFLVALQRLNESLVERRPLGEGLAVLDRIATAPAVEAAQKVRAFEANDTDEKLREASASVGRVVGSLRKANADESEVLGASIDRLYLTVGFLVCLGVATLALLWRVRSDALAFERLAEQRIAAAYAEHADRLETLHALAASTAHEVNNPLTAVMLNLEVLSSSAAAESDPVAVEAIRASVDGANRISEIVKRLRSVAAPQQKSQVELGQVIDATMKLLEHRVSPHAQVIQKLSERGAVRGEYVALGQVVSNLVVNALEAFGNRPVAQNLITIETHGVDGDWVELIVADNGPGWDPGAVEKLLLPFVTTKATGSGLGLFVCKQIVEGFDGELKLLRSADAGARVSVRLRRV